MFGIVLNVNKQRKEMQIKCIVLYCIILVLSFSLAPWSDWRDDSLKGTVIWGTQVPLQKVWTSLLYIYLLCFLLPGQISATSSFNYEVTPGYQLQVGAKKQSGSATSDIAPATVDISIQEEIDAPKFEKDSYEVEIDEDIKLSATVTNGFVIQDDDTTPDNFKCSLVNIQSEATLSTFSVIQSGDSCKLVILKQLDYSIANEFR